MVHQHDPHRLPDEAFAPGSLEFLVAGNRGRMLDPRRTPITVTGLRPDLGYFHLRIEAFEDAGALWEIPFESVGGYQFALGSAQAAPTDVAGFLAAIARFDQPLEIACDPACAQSTQAALASLETEAKIWLRAHSCFLASQAPLDLTTWQGPAELAQDLEGFMAKQGLADLEAAFAARWVSNPESGELVKGHRIVLAELGLVPYEGTLVRDPDLFTGPWSQERRAAHILARLAFVRAFFTLAGHASVPLYRGLCCDGWPRPPRNGSFLSSSFNLEVARSCSGEREEEMIGVIYRQPVPIQRIFMTYLETRALNHPFREAEAVLLWQAGNLLF